MGCYMPGAADGRGRFKRGWCYMDYCKSVLICGGDKRQLYIREMLLKDGFDVSSCALGLFDDVSVERIGEFDVVIFPVPVSLDGFCLNAPMLNSKMALDDIFHLLSSTQIVLGGMCGGIGYNMTDYYDTEEVKVKNAVPTAEGAIQIAMENSEATLYKSRCLVIGCGRIGKVLARLLKGMGAKVTVSSRREGERALLEVMGINAIRTESIVDSVGGYDIIFNTVPKTVIGCEALGKIGKSVPIIELASKPYGIDMAAAKAMGRKVIIASGLPGKLSPISAAEILKESIVKRLMETEV